MDRKHLRTSRNKTQGNACALRRGHPGPPALAPLALRRRPPAPCPRILSSERQCRAVVTLEDAGQLMGSNRVTGHKLLEHRPPQEPSVFLF